MEGAISIQEYYLTRQRQSNGMTKPIDNTTTIATDNDKVCGCHQSKNNPAKILQQLQILFYIVVIIYTVQQIANK